MKQFFYYYFTNKISQELKREIKDAKMRGFHLIFKHLRNIKSLCIVFMINLLMSLRKKVEAAWPSGQ